MISMLIAGRMLRFVDARLMVTAGLSLTALSLHMMTGFSPQMDSTPIVLSGVVQGLGLGLVFVPLSTVAFATIAPRFRADATSLFSLVRNIGSSVGISMVTVMLTHNSQINHAELGANVTPYNPQLWQLSPDAAQGGLQSLAVIDRLVTQQATMIGYIDDFRLMMLITLAALPLALLLRKPRVGGAPVTVHAD